MDVFEGNVIGGGIEAASAKNLQESQQSWLTNMSNTAYQRQVADMKAAGLNPMMAATKGGGASTPSAPVAKPPGAALSGAISSGIAMAQNQQSIDNDSARAIAEVGNKTADTSLKTAQTLTEAQRELTEHQKATKTYQEREMMAQSFLQNEKTYQKNLRLLDLEMDAKIASAQEMKARAEKQRAETENTRLERPKKEFYGRAWETGNWIGDRLDEALQSNSTDKGRGNAAEGTW